MSKPIVNTNPVANTYAGPSERIVEFSSGKPNGPGGLISVTRKDDGAVRVDVYRMDERVEVVLSKERPLYVDGVKVNELVAWYQGLGDAERQRLGLGELRAGY